MFVIGSQRAPRLFDLILSVSLLGFGSSLALAKWPKARPAHMEASATKNLAKRMSELQTSAVLGRYRKALMQPFNASGESELTPPTRCAMKHPTRGLNSFLEITVKTGIQVVDAKTLRLVAFRYRGSKCKNPHWTTIEEIDLAHSDLGLSVSSGVGRTIWFNRDGTSEKQDIQSITLESNDEAYTLTVSPVGQIRTFARS